jgi:hypothetical protein
MLAGFANLATLGALGLLIRWARQQPAALAA